MPTISSKFQVDSPAEKEVNETAFGFLTELLSTRDLSAEALRAGNAPTTFVPRYGRNVG